MNSGFGHWFGQQVKGSMKSALQGIIIGKLLETANNMVSKAYDEDEKVEQPRTENK